MTEQADETEQQPPSEEARADLPSDPGPTRAQRIALAAVLIFTVVTHLGRLSEPGKVLDPGAQQCRQVPPRSAVCYELIPLDERHYVPDARDVLAYGTESDVRVPDGEGKSGPYVVHPPVGKWFIAAGIAVFGDRPFGWRFFGSVIGCFGVLLAYLIGRRWWRSRWAAIGAAGLLSLDGLWFVQSRIAMLDIYAATFLLAGVWALIEDRARTAPHDVGPRRWRMLSALFFGLAIATKWSVAPMIAVAVGVAIAWEVRLGSAAAPEHRFGRRMATLAAPFLLVPLAVYTVSYTPWLMNEHRYAPPACEAVENRIVQLGCYQREMYHFHRDLEKFEATEDEDDAADAVEPGHPYFGEAYSWPWIGRPVAHAYDEVGTGPRRLAAHVIGLPNPLIWVAGFLAIPLLLFLTIRRDGIASLALIFILAGWVPYLVADLIDRPVFLFYATPMVPFLVFGLVHVGMRAAERWAWIRWPAGGIVVGAALMFAFFYPVLAAYPIPREGLLGWDSHMWLAADCLEEDVIKKWCWI